MGYVNAARVGSHGTVVGVRIGLDGEWLMADGETGWYSEVGFPDAAVVSFGDLYDPVLDEFIAPAE